jgi:hypothetical protein
LENKTRNRLQAIIIKREPTKHNPEPAVTLTMSMKRPTRGTAHRLELSDKETYMIVSMRNWSK